MKLFFLNYKFVICPENSVLISFNHIFRNVDNIGFEEQSGLPSIGSRVVRDKDWDWEEQDGNGPGTVVGHKQKGELFLKY